MAASCRATRSPPTTESGFGLVQALGSLDVEPIKLGSSAAAQVGDRVVIGGVGGRTRSVAGHIAAKQEFAGTWEYALDEAIFTYPSHPNWGGAGMISGDGKLIGIGSLQIERVREGRTEHLNMIVPIDLLKPILDDLRKVRPRQQAGATMARRDLDRSRRQDRRGRRVAARPCRPRGAQEQ